MFIESIELKNYRNYGELHMDFDPGTNVLYGDNAQGKTNILEAVYVCATTKSHRGSKDREIIEFGEDESHIKMQLRKDDVPYRIDMHLKKNTVFFAKNAKAAAFAASTAAESGLLDCSSVIEPSTCTLPCDALLP